MNYYNIDGVLVESQNKNDLFQYLKGLDWTNYSTDNDYVKSLSNRVNTLELNDNVNTKDNVIELFKKYNFIQNLQIVFVYGTLRKGESNHYLLKDAHYLGESSVHGYEMHTPHFSYPYIRPNKLSNRVVVEIYAVDNSQFEKLDMLEGYPTHYDRVKVKCSHKIEGWVYYSDRENPRTTIIEGGDWVKYMKNK